MKKEIVIDGNRFNNIEEFYIETERLLTKGSDIKTGHNMHAFNDILWGGFGVHEYGEPISIRWKNADKSKADFGYEATAGYYKSILMRCDPKNAAHVKELLEDARQGRGRTLFDCIVGIITEHVLDIELTFE